MEALKPSIMATRRKLKQASLMWIAGFWEACCLHRVVILCCRSRKLLIRTGQCFLLNGFIFLGSLFVLNSVVIPILEWILPDRCSGSSCQELSLLGGILKFYSFLQGGLIQLFYIFWFYPLYVFSFVLSSIWYNDIAKLGFDAMKNPKPSVAEPSKQSDALTLEYKGKTERPTSVEGIVIGILEQVYSVLLLTFFFLEVYCTGFIPFVGMALNFLLLSWMYAYYCFEYKWNFSEVSLDNRLNFFETNWAFFAGFGSPCVLAIFFVSPLVSYGIMAILFPLFVLTATGSAVEQVIANQKRNWGGAELGRLPLFFAAHSLSLWVLSLIHLESQEKTQDKKTL
ncbi:hypothetical protein SLE2022_146040 [Rubroshorea leprosula]